MAQYLLIIISVIVCFQARTSTSSPVPIFAYPRMLTWVPGDISNGPDMTKCVVDNMDIAPTRKAKMQGGDYMRIIASIEKDLSAGERLCEDEANVWNAVRKSINDNIKTGNCEEFRPKGTYSLAVCCQVLAKDQDFAFCALLRHLIFEPKVKAAAKCKANKKSHNDSDDNDDGVHLANDRT